MQTCVIHLIRGTFRYASKRYWETLAMDLRPIYTAPTVEAAWAAFETLEENWGTHYPAIPKLWRASWEQFTPFLAYGACRRMRRGEGGYALVAGWGGCWVMPVRRGLLGGS